MGRVGSHQRGRTLRFKVGWHEVGVHGVAAQGTLCHLLLAEQGACMPTYGLPAYMITPGIPFSNREKQAQSANDHNAQPGQ
jgi:hypothetical protein